jgi:hypothetical protein
MGKKLLFFCCLVLQLSCSKDSEKNEAPVYDVPEEFQPLVAGFIQEAAQRGKTLTINNLIIKYDYSMDASYCALCNTLSSDPAVQKIITVNPNVRCTNNDQEREALFFHEFGHCILGRSHNNQLLPNGDPKSIMVEHNVGLYAPCFYPIPGCEDLSYRRTYYLDELFNEQAPVPQWAE